MERKSLGKGISALIPEKEPENQSQDKVLLLSPAKIKPNPYQPREHFDNDSLEELKQSIKEKGVIQPVVVRRKGDYYELIAGERRFRAATALNLAQIPAIIRDAEDIDSLELSLIENIQRQNLNSIEEARAYRYLIDKFNLTQEQVSNALGKSRVFVANTLRLLDLPQEIQEEIRKGRISAGHGKVLLEVEDVNQQRRLVQEIISKGLSVRELESAVKKHRPKITRRKSSQASPDAYITVIEEELQQILATKVRVSKRKKRGHIQIEFYSQEDLERILNQIRKGQQ